ncbi:amidohydrolase [bacterium]|nr:amidohydrolase [bacterium]
MADKLFIEGIILSQDENQQQYSQMAIQGNHILAVGDNLLEFSSPDTETIDLHGAVIVPGFIDAHLHFLSGGKNLLAAPLNEARSKEQFIRLVSRFAKNRTAGSWIEAGGWNEHLFADKELPHREWLDTVAPGHPMLLYRHDGHSGIANTLALELAGITSKTPNPDAGVIDRDSYGEPTGLLRDSAMGLVGALIPNDSEEELERNLITSQQYLLEQGVTAVGDMINNMNQFKFLQKMARAGKLKIRISAYTPVLQWTEMKALLEDGIYEDEWFQFKGLKGFSDGSLGSHTALMLEPYDDTPDSAGIYATDWEDPGLIRNILIEADLLGHQAVIHAIGDRANREVLDLFESVIEANGDRDRRFRIEHAQHVHSGDQDRFATLDVIASVQPAHCVDDSRYVEKLLGTRCSYAYPFKSLLNKHTRLAFGSDWPVSEADPVTTIHAAIHRAGWRVEEAPGFSTALKAHTRDAAFAGFRDHDLGMLRPGYLADFVILDKRFLTLQAIETAPGNLIQTVYVDGEKI